MLPYLLGCIGSFCLLEGLKINHPLNGDDQAVYIPFELMLIGLFKKQGIVNLDRLFDIFECSLGLQHYDYTS